MIEPAKVKANERDGKIASTWLLALPDLGLWGACHAIKKRMTKVVRTIDWTGTPWLPSLPRLPEHTPVGGC
jgi:hypothetical protein